MMYVEAILAKNADFSQAMARLEEGMKETLKEIDQDFQKTVRTWKRKPNFETLLESSMDLLIGEVSTTSDIYRYVSGGTRVRYATMTPDFLAKTVPHWVGSRPGRGGLLIVNKKRPRPGITARKFAENIAKKQFPYFVRRMDSIMQQVAAQSGHAARR